MTPALCIVKNNNRDELQANLQATFDTVDAQPLACSRWNETPLGIQFMCTHVLHLEQPPKCLITTAAQDLLWYYRQPTSEVGRPAAAYLASASADRDR